MLVSAWNEVIQTTIPHCFKKAKTSEKDQTIAINDEDDPFKDINKNLKELREKESSLVPENMMMMMMMMMMMDIVDGY